MTQRSEDRMVNDLWQNMESAFESSRNAKDAMMCLERSIVENFGPIRRLPSDVRESLESLCETVDKLEKSTLRSVSCIDDTFHILMGGRKLNRDQFHFMTALGGLIYPNLGTGLLNYTNKGVGLSEFDDYDVYCLFCYEDEKRYAIIDPQKPPEPPHKWDIGSNESGYRSVGVKITNAPQAPEDLSWDKLSSAQQLFFEKYLPDVAGRFSRQELE